MAGIPLHHWTSRRRGFLERTLADLALILEHADHHHHLQTAQPGFLQILDPRVKLLAAVVLMILAASDQRIPGIAAVLAFTILLALFSRLPWQPLARLWAGVGLLAAMLAVPALFVTPGPALWTTPLNGWTLTQTGAFVAAKLLLRALTSSTLAAVLVLSTPWQNVLKALRQFRVPVVVVVLIAMSYRYIFLLLHTAVEMIQARRSRTAGQLPAAERRRLALSGIGVLLERAIHLGNEIHLAMQARGYRGEVHVLDEFRLHPRDWAALALLLLAASAVLAGRAS